MNVVIRGARRIGMASLNQKFCSRSESESDPELKNVIRSDPIRIVFILSDPMTKIAVRSDLK
jgi:hypothetical protein